MVNSMGYKAIVCHHPRMLESGFSFGPRHYMSRVRPLDPLSRTFTIGLDSPARTKVEVYAMNGRRVFSIDNVMAAGAACTVQKGQLTDSSIDETEPNS